MEVIYGIKAKDVNDPHIINAIRSTNDVFIPSRPGQFLVDFFPILKYVPSWMPRAEFKRKAQEWNRIVEDNRNLPFSQVKEDIKRGTASFSAVSSLLSQYEDSLAKVVEDDPTLKPETMEESIRDMASVANAAGSETSIVAIMTFFLMMANRPDIQKEAQKELDAVIGTDRLPIYEDRLLLPYITAITKEILRWHAIVPLGFPHVLTKSDEYAGYLIPKGTIVIPNAWAISRDPEVYPDPDTLNPSRWLIDTEQGRKFNTAIQDSGFVFGFGRRICPGMYLGEDMVFLAIASTLACFYISPLDERGQPTAHIKEQFVESITLTPVPFKVALTPRSEKAAALIKETAIIEA